MLPNLYNASIYLFGLIIKLASFWNHKAKLRIIGCKNIFAQLQNKLNHSKPTIWFHCASLGEFEQARPLIEHLKKEKNDHQILISFYSPSGYEIQKNYLLADYVCYMPLDTKKNAKKFISIVNPQLVIFIKYEFWLNFLQTLGKKKIKTIVVCAIFRKNQIFFKPYGSFMRKALKNISHFFVQNENSKTLLQNIGVTNVTIGGDSRYSRVIDIKNENTVLDWVENFKKNHKLFVAGSTWKNDEKMLVKLINQTHTDTKFIIAPHNIINKDIQILKKNIQKKVILFSEMKNTITNDYSVIILDTIGMLTKVYKYADIGFVGGGFDKGGVHNVLEPCVFSIPVIIGSVYQKYTEAVNMVKMGGCLEVSNFEKLYKVFHKLIENKHFKTTTGQKVFKFIYNEHIYFSHTKQIISS